MSEGITLTGHIATTKTSTISKACKPLFASTDITYFCYLRRYHDGYFTFLPTMIDFGNYLFQDSVYPDTWFAGIAFDELNSGYMFWDIAGKMSPEDIRYIARDVSNYFKLSSGIEIIEKNEEHCDFYSFSSHSPEIYSIPLQFLYQFIYYFKHTCRSLLLDAYDNRLPLNNQTIVLSTNPIMNLHNNISKENEAFNVKRYYLDGDYEGVFLTKREAMIIKKMSEGLIVKTLADLLNVSPRTLEHHIVNIKNKLNVSRMTEILHIARENKIIF